MVGLGCRFRAVSQLGGDFIEQNGSSLGIQLRADFANP